MKNTIKKLIAFTPQEWSEIENYRFLNRIDKQTDAVKELIDFGKIYRKEKFEKATKEAFEEYDLMLKRLAKR